MRAYASVKTMEKWLNVEFESSTINTPQFNSFIKDVKQAIKKQAGAKLELVGFTKGHFYFSGFLMNKETGKLAYFSSDDVRYSVNGWFNCLLIRTAEHIKDFKGGRNNFIKFKNLGEKAGLITN